MGLGPRLNQTKIKAGPRPPLKIEARVGIQAPAEVIWELLSDLSSWGSWSQIYPKAEGQVRIGAPVTATLALPGEARRDVRAQIVEWVPLEQIIWTEAQWRGWSRSTRFFEIEELDKTACIFANGELFETLVSRWYGDRRRRAMKKGFAAMGEALKARAETLWQATNA